MKLKFLGAEYVRTNNGTLDAHIAGRYRGLAWQTRPKTGVQRREVTLTFLGRSYQSEV